MANVWLAWPFSLSVFLLLAVLFAESPRFLPYCITNLIQFDVRLKVLPPNLSQMIIIAFQLVRQVGRTTILPIFGLLLLFVWSHNTNMRAHCVFSMCFLWLLFFPNVSGIHQGDSSKYAALFYRQTHKNPITLRHKSEIAFVLQIISCMI